MIKAKALMLLRLVSSLIYLILSLALFFIDLISINDISIVILLLLSLSSSFVIIIGLKLEIKLFIEHFKLLILIPVALIILTEFFTMIIKINVLFLNLIFLISALIGMHNWNHSLSIYKKKKVLFGVMSLVYYLINLVLQFNINLLQSYLVVRFIILNTILVSAILILIIEFVMKRKGYLKYL